MSIHIGQKIKEVFEASGMTISEFARRAQTTRQNVYGIFERNSIDTALLERISSVLSYNFFSLYSTEGTPLSGVSEPDIDYNTAQPSEKIVLQIELSGAKKDEVLRIALGEEAAKAIKKKA